MLNRQLTSQLTLLILRLPDGIPVDIAVNKNFGPFVLVVIVAADVFVVGHVAAFGAVAIVSVQRVAVVLAHGDSSFLVNGYQSLVAGTALLQNAV